LKIPVKIVERIYSQIFQLIANLKRERWAFFRIIMNLKSVSSTKLRNLHPHWLVAVPLFLTVTGCGAQTGSTPTAAGDAPPADIAPAPTAPNEKVPAADAKTDKATDTSTPDPKYKIVNEADPRMPPELIAALDKVKVAPPPKSMAVPKTARVKLETSQGPITVELNGQAAPLHVKNFLYLSKIGFYDATVFHRYEPGFVIQGGDPLSKNPALKEYFGTGGPGYQVPREHNSLKHNAMVIAAARGEDPDSAGSQFYFTLEAAPNLDQGDGYTVFGKVVDGAENVLKLRAGDKLKKVEIVSPKS
jgi:cyclophilin family peptidyl-prolyl cis-trans isomerase